MVGRGIKFRKGVVIQARMSATRLPNKVLLSLPFGSDSNVLEQIVKRAQKVENMNEIIIATTENTRDDVLQSVSDRLKVRCFRGDEDNVLSRFFFAAQKNKLDIIVRLTADNPCLDYKLIEAVLKVHIKEKNDYTFTENYPLGMNVEVISFSALKESFKKADDDYEKEHVTPYLIRHRKEFKVAEIKVRDCSYSEIRLTLDTEEDYALICAVYEYLYQKNEFFGLDEIVGLFNKKSWLKLINKKIVQKGFLDSLDSELREAIRILKLQGLMKAKGFLESYIK